MVMNSFSGFIQKNKIIILVICLSFLLTNRNGSILIGLSCGRLGNQFFSTIRSWNFCFISAIRCKPYSTETFLSVQYFSRFVICSNCSDTSSEVIIFSLGSLSNDIMGGMAYDFKEHQMPFLVFFLYSASIFLPATLLFLHTQPSTAYCVDSQSGLIQCS